MEDVKEKACSNMRLSTLKLSFKFNVTVLISSHASHDLISLRYGLPMNESF